MKKIKNIRHIIQALWIALTNGYVYGFIEGKIYTGKTKKMCLPGLNCYSCPGALGACPIGSLQSVLNSAQFRVSCYVIGFLMIVGSIMGRFVCGFLCPFGFVQDMLYKIPLFKKMKNFKGHKFLIKLKYVILLLFVLLLPALIQDAGGNGSPWFCEYICPSGTLMGGIPLLIARESLRTTIGIRFIWKAVLLITVLVLSIKWYRPFCKYICPLGAVYSIFNGFSLYRYEIDKNSCDGCGACQKACKMDIKVYETPNNPECIRCGDCMNACPHKAIHTCKYRK